MKYLSDLLAHYEPNNGFATKFKSGRKELDVCPGPCMRDTCPHTNPYIDRDLKHMVYRTCARTGFDSRADYRSLHR